MGAWMKKADASGIYRMQHFVCTLKQDQSLVEAARRSCRPMIHVTTTVSNPVRKNPDLSTSLCRIVREPKSLGQPALLVPICSPPENEVHPISFPAPTLGPSLMRGQYLEQPAEPRKPNYSLLL
jgi:hypothetical protein